MAQWHDYLKFRDGFASILDERFYPLPWLDAQVWSQLVKLWCCEDAAILVELRTYPSGAKEVHGLAATGNMESIIGLIPLAEQWGRENGCVVATIESREGWKRALKSYGYVPYQTVIRKEL